MARLNSTKWILGIALIVVLTLLVTNFSTLMGNSSGDNNQLTATPKLTYTIRRSNLDVSVVEQGVLESSENTEIKCRVRGKNTVTWVIENGTEVKPGDVLVQLDTLAIEDAINERSKYAHLSRASAENSHALLERAKLAIKEYADGRFVSLLMRAKQQLTIAENNLVRAKNSQEHNLKLASRGYARDLSVEQSKVNVRQAELEVEVRKSDINVLNDFTKRMQLETLQGDLKSAEATHKANVERAELDETRRDLAKLEFDYCVIKAEKSGLVIFPSAAEWKESPDVAEGATVHKDQILLLMPDLSRMQVKVGIHESIVDRVELGMLAKISLPDEVLDGKVSEISSVARPAGWWTGNVVKYDTIVELPGRPGLKPGMSTEVKVVIAQHRDVLTIPVSAVLETNNESLCWVTDGQSYNRRSLKLGDSNDVFLVVHEGLAEGEEVVLNPLAYIKEAQDEALKASEELAAEAGNRNKAEPTGIEKTADGK